MITVLQYHRHSCHPKLNARLYSKNRLKLLLYPSGTFSSPIRCLPLDPSDPPFPSSADTEGCDQDLTSHHTGDSSNGNSNSGDGGQVTIQPSDLSQLPVIYLTDGLEIADLDAEEVDGDAETRDGAASHLLVQVPPVYERQQMAHQNDFCEFRRWGMLGTFAFGETEGGGGRVCHGWIGFSLLAWMSSQVRCFAMCPI